MGPQGPSQGLRGAHGSPRAPPGSPRGGHGSPRAPPGPPTPGILWVPTPGPPWGPRGATAKKEKGFPFQQRGDYSQDYIVFIAINGIPIKMTVMTIHDADGDADGNGDDDDGMKNE